MAITKVIATKQRAERRKMGLFRFVRTLQYVALGYGGIASFSDKGKFYFWGKLSEEHADVCD
jgi:hypothetical protein